MKDPQITVVVVPRERFSCTQESLESIYQYTEVPFTLVYVDGNSPTRVKRYLEAQAKAKNFRLVRTNYYLSPNEARNIGLTHANTKYLVFIDNDVIVSPGWLKALINCAEETGAAVVGPLMCQDKPLHETIHFAGGESHIVTDIHGKRHLREKMYKQGQKVAEVRPKLQRTPTELTEFHCMLVRTQILEDTGVLDEAMFNTKEHLDFCMTVAKAGGTVYFEPDSLATYVPGPPLELTDIPFYILRWSNAWTIASLEHLRQKWDLAMDGYFKRKYKSLGWRRRKTVIGPLSRRLSFGFSKKITNLILNIVDKKMESYLINRYFSAKSQFQKKRVQATTEGRKTAQSYSKA